MKKLMALLLVALLLPLGAQAADIVVHGLTARTVREVLISRGEGIYSEAVASRYTGNGLEWTLNVGVCEGPLTMEYRLDTGEIVTLPLTIPAVDHADRDANLFWPVDGMMINRHEYHYYGDVLRAYTGPHDGACGEIDPGLIHNFALFGREGEYVYGYIVYDQNKIRGAYMKPTGFTTGINSLPSMEWRPVAAEALRSALVYTGPGIDFDTGFRRGTDGYDSRLRAGEPLWILCQQGEYLFVEDEAHNRGWVPTYAVVLK